METRRSKRKDPETSEPSPDKSNDNKSRRTSSRAQASNSRQAAQSSRSHQQSQQLNQNRASGSRSSQDKSQGDPSPRSGRQTRSSARAAATAAASAEGGQASGAAAAASSGRDILNSVTRDQAPAPAGPSSSGPAANVPPSDQVPEGPSTGPGAEEDMAGRQRSGHADGDDDKDMDPFGRNLASASSALQGLLRKLGAGFEDILPMGGMSSSKVKSIVAGLKQMDDESAQLSSLTELCELLSISTEDTLAAFPVETVVPLLVQLLNMEHNPDIMLLAARALTFMADVLPPSTSAIVRHGAVPAFCARLLTIEYIDLAEQSLQALEKLSHDHSHALLQNGGLLAVLSYLDFFPTGVQRVAVATAANMCHGLTAENSEAVKAAVPILTGLLQYQDAKVVDNACVALSHIADSFSTNAELLDVLSSGGLINQALQLVSISETGCMTSQLSLGTYFGLLKLLVTCASGSPQVALNLLQAGAMDTVCALLATSSLLSTSTNPSAVLRSADQLFIVVALACELLPPVPDATAVLTQDLPALKPEDQAGGSSNGRAQFLRDHQGLAQRVCKELLPLLLQVYSATVLPEVRHKCLSTVTKVLYYATPEVLQEALKDIPVSSFVGSLLTGRDLTAAAHAMHMAEVLMAKLPAVFKPFFLKEGVVHAMEQVAASAPAGGAGAGVASGAAPAASGSRVTRASTRREPRDEQQADNKGKAVATAGGNGSGSSEPSPATARGKSPAASGAGAAKSASGKPAGAAGGPSLKEALAARAARFRSTHYDDADSKALLETDGLKLLRTLCQQLPAEPSQALTTMFQALQGAAGSSSSSGKQDAAPAGATAVASVSVFELLSSGAIKKLLGWLKGAGIPASVPVPEREQQLLARIKIFVEIAMAPGSGSQPPLLYLVRKLQSALSAVEAFPVMCSRVSHHAASGRSGAGGSSGVGQARGGQSNGAAFSPGSLSSGLVALTQPFKLRLCRHTQEKQLKEYSQNIVLIEPLATMTAIEDFLWPRVYRSQAAAAAATTTAAQAAPEPAPAAGAPGASAPAASGAAPSGTAGVSTRTRSSSRLGSGASAASAPVPAAAASGAAATASGAAAGSGRAQPQPIPDSDNRRTTRAQARARQEAQARAEQQSQHDEREAGRAGGRRGRAASTATSEGAQPMEEDDFLLHGDEDHDDEDHDMEDGDGAHDHDGDGDGDGDGVFDDDEDFEEEMDAEDDQPDIGNMHVHDLHVDGDAATAAAGAAAAAAAAASGAAAPEAHASAAAPSAGDAAAAPGNATAPPAAAAAASGRPAGAWGSRDGAAGSSAAHQPSSKLAFFIGEQRLSSGATVFQAIQQMSVGSSGPAPEAGEEQDEEGGVQRGRGRRLWDDVYTLHYRQADACEDEAGGAGSSSGTAGETAGAAAAHSPLHELLSVRVPEELAASEQCREVLQLLQLVEVSNRLGPRLVASLEHGTLSEAGSVTPATASQGATAAAPGTAGCGLSAAARRGSGVPAPALAFGRVAREEYVSSKLGSKLAQQLKDVLSICGGGLPAWCRQLVVSCKMLFPFEVRRRYFYCTAFGLGRALQHMQALHQAEAGGTAAADREARDLRIGRLQRQKVRVSRKRILESAIKVMELYAKHRAVLELEYFGEVGTGLGPTLEFYTLLSHELQKRELGMWRHEDAAQPEQGQGQGQGAEGEDKGEKGGSGAQPMEVDGAARPAAAAASVADRGERPAAAASASAHVDPWHDASEFVNAPYGLFPRPLPPAERQAGSKVLDYFKLLGRTLAKALQDGRLVDLPLNYAFHRALLGRSLDMFDIARFDPGLGSSLEKLASAVAAWQAGGRQGPLLLDGCPIQDLCLTFTLPGHSSYELLPNGADTPVDASNVERYVEAVVDATIGSGIAAQLAAFREGFQEVFPFSALDAFYEDEIETMLCGSGERWSVQGLAESIKFDHGYTAASTPVKHFLEILSDMDAADQRRFLRFVTGCPRLPPGGIASLQPRLTVVRKHPSVGPETTPGSTPVGSFQDRPAGPSGSSLASLADGDLPSVMTCANYIKLPPYSSKAVMLERLMFAIREGQGSFDLS